MDGIYADYSNVVLQADPPLNSTGSFKYGNGNLWSINRDAGGFSWRETSYIKDSYEMSLVKPNGDTPAFSLLVKGDNFPSVQQNMNQFRLLLGYIAVSRSEIKSLHGLLSTMNLSVETEIDMDSQNEVVLLKGKNNEAELSIWFIHKDYYVPVRILFEHTLPIDDNTKLICGDYLFRDFQMVEGILYPHEITTTEITVHGVSIRNQDGIVQFVPYNEFLKLQKLQANNGPAPKDFSEYGVGAKISDDTPTISISSKCILSNVKLKQKFTLKDFAITTPIDEESPIHVKNAPHLQYVWRDGKPVPLFDQSLLSSRGLKFFGSPASPRFWMILIGIILIVGTLSHKTYTFVKTR